VLLPPSDTLWQMEREAHSPTSPAKDAQTCDAFTDALKKVANAGAVSSRAAIQASKATKPSRHTRFVYNPAKGRV
jgi:hypothetical protein